MKILVTGGCGFIGSNFIRHMLTKYPDYEIVNLDALTYAGNIDNLRDLDTKRLRTVTGSIVNADIVSSITKEVDAVVNFAAESHVDRSIENAKPFLETNIIGLQTLLDSAMKASNIKRFVHLSTDEVYGSLETEDGKFTETTPLDPRSPYSASKAAGDLLLRAYNKTYGYTAIMVRPSNNYGPRQFPEKLIPLMITNLMEGAPVPVYGEGANVRDWLFVLDNCEAIDTILHKGKDGEVYNVGGDCERKNIDIVKAALRVMGKDESHIKYVKDRPGHDFRYALDNSKITRELGWKPTVKIEDGIVKTIEWYMENKWWWQPLKSRLTAESGGFWK
ncbi:MAG: dTDP-glucose 4,6-dehydratase [Nitrospirae bacterium]|nr:dTDP-glucose 4,6-dehydratase [Nitrospirota bacterium]MBF0534332.1 dTDP-glucose 4,6-dehydratase [Nitrospirota bacterium]MBF0615687.1 dTDP-glucose 4,6-dehydratase [Nitrospirota bacterium]